MRIFPAWMICFALTLLTTGLQGQHLTPDTLLQWISRDKASAAIAYLEKQHPGFIDQESRLRPQELSSAFLLAVAFVIEGEEQKAVDLRARIVQYSISGQSTRELLRFVFSAGFKFIMQREAYVFIQETGIILARAHDEPIARFSFLQQLFSMYQLSNQPASMVPILHEMKMLGRDDAYLNHLFHMHSGLFHCAWQPDSCVYFFEKYLVEGQRYVGKDNGGFLADPEYSLRKDSSVMAGAIMEYAKYYLKLGDLRKAGQLLITADKLIPDTSSFALLRIQNQLALSAVYVDLVHPAQALEHARKAAEIADRFALMRIRNTRVAVTMGHAYLANGDYATATAVLQQAFHDIARNVNCQDPKKQALRLAYLFALQDQYPTAQQWLDTASAILCPEDNEMAFFTHISAGLIASDEGLQQKARADLASAYAIASAHQFLGWKLTALQMQFRTEKKWGLTKEALLSLEHLNHLKDSLYRTGQDVAIFDINASYQKSLQDETIARLDALQTMQQTKIEFQRKGILTLALVLIVLGGLLTLAWQLYQRVKKANVALSKSMNEKNVLLREIHHRVKNNLQVISSLLKLQSGYIKDEAAVQAIAEGRSRVQSMALLHQNLYRDDNLTGVNMSDYFDTLIQGLFDTYNISPDRIHLHKQVDSLQLDVDTVVPLGLITNELISNALKHGFPNGQSGDLFVTMFERGAELILRIRDTGVGQHSVNQSDGFGMKLIRTLCEKLEADIHIVSSEGTIVEVTIRDYSKAA